MSIRHFFILSHSLALVQKKMAAKSWSTTSESEHERLEESDIEWKWKNHHHNSKAVRKRFSILLLLFHAFAWLASQSHPSSKMPWHCSSTRKKNFLLLFSCTWQWRNYKCCISICITMKKRRWFSSFFSFHSMP